MSEKRRRNARIRAGHLQALSVAGAMALATPASAFNVDATIDEVRRAFGAQTVASLAVGSRGLVSSLFTTFCIADGRLKLPAATEQATANASGPTLYAVERLDDTSVALSPAGGATARLDPESLEALTTQVSLAPDCNVSHREATLLDVTTLMGATSLIELTSRARASLTRTTTAAQNAAGAGGAGATATDGSANRPAGAAAGGVGGAWEVAVTEAPGGGPPAVIISARARNEVSATLALRCRGGETAMYVVTDTLLPLTEAYRIEVDIARDDDALQREEATTSTTNETFFLRNPIAKAVLLLGARQYRMSYVDATGDKHEPVFDVADLDVHLPRLRLACGW